MPVDVGADILVEDVGSMRSVMGSRFARSVPYFIFGHSMGSFVVRLPDQIRRGSFGCHHMRNGEQAPRGGAFREPRRALLADKKGERYVSPFLHSLADGAYGKAVRNARTSFDWLSYDEANVDAYIADEMCGCPFTVGAYASLFSLVERAARLDLAMGVPKDLPMFYIAGAERTPSAITGTGCAMPSRSCVAAGRRRYQDQTIRGNAARDSQRNRPRPSVRGRARMARGPRGRERLSGRGSSHGKVRHRARSGTTSSRAVLFDRAGRPVASVQRPFPQIYPQPGWVEHDPHDILVSARCAHRAARVRGARARRRRFHRHHQPARNHHRVEPAHRRADCATPSYGSAVAPRR